MRNLKKILALALALVMTLSVMTVANAAFTDSSSVDAKYTEAVDVLSGMGVFKGTGDGTTFSPKAEITRAEVAAIIYRIVTGDVTDTQAGIYADYAKFADVNTNAWYAGYVGYCANAELIKGDGKNFYPLTKVTGYQALAMILRAIGYDVNGEFTGSGWEVRVAQIAQQREILVNINAGTLGTNASREMVAEILFQAIQKSTVVYTPALGYYTANLVNANGLTNSLGAKNFGLTYNTGIVVGNQATGETCTKINIGTTNGGYDYTTATSFATTTDLDLFGHAVKVWYDSRATVGAYTTYATFDKATVATVTEAKTNAAAYAAGFKVAANLATSTAAATAAYCNDSYGAQYWAGNAQSNYPIYVMISNSADKSLDLIIGVDASVRLVAAVNNYVATPTVTFSTLGTKNRANITSGVENAVVGNYVIVKEITGTANTATANAPYYALDTVTKTATGKIISIAVDGTVTLANGTTIAKSPLYNYSDVAKSEAAGVELTFVLDNNGKYVGAVQPAAEWLYATYVYWEQTGTSTITYYLQGVNTDGTITQAITVDKDAYDDLKKTISYKNYGGDTISATGTYKMVKLTDSTTTAGAKTIVTNANWTDNLDATLTATSYQVKAGEFLTASTVYHVISGFGDTLKVTPYTGITALLDGATSVDAKGVYSKTTLSTTTTSNYNYALTNVLLSSADLTYTGNFFYTGTTDPAATAAFYANNNVKQYNLYKAGESTKTSVWVDTQNGATPAKDTFYTYTKSYNVALGADVYTLTAKMNGGFGWGYAGLTVTQAVDSALGYIAIDDWANDPQFDASKAQVIDLTVGGAITSVSALNTAVETNTVKIDCLFNADKTVAVIYVVSVTNAN